MDESTKIHETAEPITNATGAQVGWRVKIKDFNFDAIEHNDGTITSYIEWGDDQGEDMAGHSSWRDVEGHLKTLLWATRDRTTTNTHI